MKKFLHYNLTKLLEVNYDTFCIGIGFVDGDVLEFTFRNIKNSGWVDVKKILWLLLISAKK